MPKHLAPLVIVGILVATTAGHAQTANSCEGTMTEQLRRLSEACVQQALAFVAREPQSTATISGEKDKFYVRIDRDGSDLVARAVSERNYPYMKPETIDRLKAAGWMPPENESADYTKRFGGGDTAKAAQDVMDALGAYGLKRDEASSLTIARKS